MAHILLMVVGTDGDFQPMARIGVALKARGHDVTMIASCYFAERARRAGLDFAAFDTPEEYERFIADGEYANSPQGSLVYIQRHILPKIRVQYDLIREHCRSRETVLLPQNQFFIIAQIMAEKLAIPVVPVFLAPSFLFGMAILENVIRATFGDAINQGRAELDLPPVHDWSAWIRRNRRYIALWPEWYAAVGPDWAPRVVQAGFVVPDAARPGELPGKLQSALGVGDPPILISGGTGRFVGPAFYAAGAEACRRLGRRGLLVTRHADLLPPELPPGVTWFEELPFANLLPHVGAIIHHGGVGTSCQALAAGIPQMILPLGADRPDNAERLERLGVARSLLRSHWQPDAVAAALQQLLGDPAVRSRCREMAQRLQESDALATVCDTIAGLLADEAARQDDGLSTQPKLPAAPARAEEPAASQDAVLRQVDHLSQERLELLARLLKQKQSSAPQEQEATIQRQPRTGVADAFPLSFAQQRLWLLDQWAPGSPAYHLPGALRLEGSLDLRALWSSLRALIRRHEVLRTIFTAADGQPVQVIHPPDGSPALPLLDLRALPAAQEALLRTLARQGAARPFDLARGPLLRVALLRLAGDAHVLLLTMHHIIADGWSLDRFLRELAGLYAGFRAGQPAPLPDLPIQYADFAVWQRQSLAGAARERQLDYWREQLAGAPQLLELPADHARPARPTFGGARHPLALGRDHSDALVAMSQRVGATLFMTMLAAFQVLLHRYTGQDDLLVGAPIANRTRTEIEALIGYFVNTLVLRGDLRGNSPFLTLLQRVRRTCLDAYAHQDLPFEQIVEALQPTRDPRLAPLVQVVLAWQATGLPLLETAGLTLRPFDVASGSTKFDLTLDLVETSKGVRGAFEYATDLFETATIARLARHMQTLLAGIAADPQQRIGELSLLSAAEREQAFVEWNDTRRGVRDHGSGIRSTALHKRRACLPRRHQGTKLPKHARIFVSSRLRGWYLKGSAGRRTYPVSDLLTSDSWLLTSAFEAQVARAPDVVALVYAGHALTYRALDAQATRLAHHLRAHAVGPDVLVGLCVERSLEALVGILGILKAGGAYVPIDPAYPPERIAFMLEDSRAAVLITQGAIYDLRFTIYDLEESQPTIVNRKSKIVNIDADWPAIAQTPVAGPLPAARSEQLAYVIYTSGSTGTPKGVMVTRGGLLNLCYGLRSFFDDPAVQHVGLITSISFDISVNQIFPTLLFGRTLHIIPEAVKYDRPALMAELRRQQLHLLDGVPSYMHMILSSGEAWPAGIALRYLLIGGEKLEPRLLALIFEQLGAQLAVVNIYGLTEISDVNAFKVLRSADCAGPVTIGRPLQNNRIYLLNPQYELQPIGVAGELCIAGESLARGYLDRPELTAEKFIPNPFAMPEDERRKTKDEDSYLSFVLRPSSFVRLCKTGDLGRWRADGQIELLGRLDQQVKLRGFRIEVGEIEAALAEQTGVRECVVMVREDTPGDARLVAYIVPAETLKDERRTINEPERSSSSFIVHRSSLVSGLRNYLKHKLPEYMLPSAFVLLEALPKTPNGKVDRKALPAPDLAGAAERNYVMPRTPIEEVLARIWAQTLHVARVGVEDSFFELGGHSLLAVQLVAHLRTTFQVDLPFRSLFEATTIAELARVIVAHEARPGQSDRIARILKRLDAMSAEDAHALLAQKEQKTSAR